MVLSHPRRISTGPFLIHGYKQVEKDLVWQVIDKELNILREQVKEYLNELDVLHNTFIKE